MDGCGEAGQEPSTWTNHFGGDGWAPIHRYRTALHDFNVTSWPGWVQGPGLTQKKQLWGEGDPQ